MVVVETATKPSLFAHFWQGAESLMPATQNDIRTSKSAPSPSFSLLTSKCASRQNVVHFFNISTSNSGPRPSVFNTFDFEMCFAPQRRALFRHLNFQKRSEHGVLYILTWTCSLRHNGVQLFISHLARWLCIRRFSEPTFRPSGATNHWKNTVFPLSYLFAHLDLLSSKTFSFLIFFLLFSYLLFSDSSHLCFSHVHIVGSLTSKLPSNMVYQHFPPEVAILFRNL